MTVLTSRKSTKFDDTKAGWRLFALRNRYQLAKTILKYGDMTDGFHRPLLLASQTRATPKMLHMVARGNFKTSGLTVAGAIQRICNNPDVRILIASNKAANAESMLAEIKGHLADPKWPWMFPEIFVNEPERNAERWTTGQITVKRKRRAKEATIETNGVEGELTSKHYEVGIFDDLVGLENSQTREERQKVIRWFEAAQSLVDQPNADAAIQDIIGTPWDFDDLYAHLLAKRAKREIPLALWRVAAWVPDPNGVEVPGYGRVRATFPERFPIPRLLQIRKTIGASRFSSQYLLSPTDPETAVFKRLEPSASHPYGIPAIKSRRDMPPLDSLWLAITIDPAISQKGWADYSAISVCGWDHSNNQHVLWLRWGKWTETEMIEQTYLAYNHFLHRGNRPGVVAIEAVAFQSLYRHLFTSAGEKRGQHLVVTGLERDTKKKKQVRQQVLEPGWNSGEIILYDDLDALHDLLDMAAKYRLDKELTRDDLLDVLADNHQMRLRPQADAPAPTGHDGEIADRLAAERAVQEQRRAQSLAPLDGASVRVARLAAMERARAEEERNLVALGAGMDESFTVAGW